MSLLKTLLPFIDKFPSWQVELASGLAVIGIIFLIVLASHVWWGLAIVGLIFSVFYEGKLDANGWSWKDVLQRCAGLAVGIGIWEIFRR